MKKAVLTLSLLMSATTFAKGKALVDKCLDKAENNGAMIQCVSEEYQRQDKKLNKEYKVLMKELNKDNSDEGKEIVRRVINAERAWINFRDTSCDVDGIEMLGGSGESLVVSGCLGRVTRERVNYVIGLQKTLVQKDASTCEEGDISCNR
ncbi:MAG: lysozyme inhibitor LprI family protein [Pseudobdellovibrionaceae bacterium]